MILVTEHEPVFLAFGRPYYVRFPGLMAEVDRPIPIARDAFWSLAPRFDLP